MPLRSWSSPVTAVLDWNGDFVVYNPLSGHTHILDLVAAEVLTAITQQPQSDAMLRECIAALLDVPNDAALATRIDEILDHLDDIGLAEPVC